MSHNQPGPYGPPPPQGQPGPYGGPPPQGQPGPYGQQPPGQPGPYGRQPGPYGGRPGYGYPQQAPGPQGVPPQQPQPGYGHPQQPGPYGQQPPAPPYGGQMPAPPAQPKKKTGLIVGGVVLALAVIGGGVYFALSGDGGASNSDVADSTKGYKLTPAASVDDFKKSTGSSASEPSGPMTGEQKSRAEAMGIKNPQKAGAEYLSGSEDNPLTAKFLSLTGTWGEVTDPAKVIDGSFMSAKQEVEKTDDSKVSLVGSAEQVTPSGFKGALMKCQNLKVVNEEGDGTAAKGPKEFLTPVCVWADYSTVGVVVGLDVGGALTEKPMSQDDLAALTAKLYNTSRTKL
ncbi:hypothetical protein [Streptomyces sp. PTD5-9]|uniref:hypothetical protein n=1 Tax=Streptomyces sp. PTD5-9 TaxID=3120150 RepID=UPI003009E541